VYVPHGRAARGHVKNGLGSRVPKAFLVVIAVVAPVAGTLVGGVVGVGAWSGRGGGCLGHLGGGMLDPFYPAVCSTAWRTGLAIGALAGVGTVAWAATSRSRGRTIMHGAVTGLIAFVLGMGGMAYGIYLAADLMQEDPHGPSFTDATIHSRGTVGFLAGTAVGAIVLVIERAVERREGAPTHRE
jgi:hypothetical protein